VTLATAAPAEQTALALAPKGILVAGRWRDTDDGLPVEDPSTGAVLCEVADASAADAVAALDAAVEAAEGWASHPPRERGEILRRGFERIISAREELALLMTLEMGKPLAESRAEVAYAAEFLRWFAEEAVRIEGRYGLAPDGSSRLMVTKGPVGPCLLITPWNFPMAMGTRKIGPAVAAGCTMVAALDARAR
jgi:succinate-semialdehyde dehydrogenase/glutarate-semialdehyde dehydrogenase